MMKTLMLCLGFFALGVQAQAGTFQAKTMRDTLSAREVERGLLLGKGWLEFGLGTDMKTANSSWNTDGTIKDWDSAQFLYTTERLDIRYGIARRGEMYWQIKTHYVRLTNEALDTNTSQFGLGDPKFGYKWEAFHSVAPVTSLILYGEFKGPAGNESPGNAVGGPTTFTNFVLTTGTPDLTVGAAAKRQLGPIALTADLAYVRRFSGAVMYVVETEYHAFNGRIAPGDIKRAYGDVLVQLGPVALNGGALVQMRESVRVGSTTDGWFPGSELNEIEGSDGWSVDGITGMTLNVSRGVDLVAGVTVPVRGEDYAFFPIEEIHPSRGNTYSGTIEFRY